MLLNLFITINIIPAENIYSIRIHRANPYAARKHPETIPCKGEFISTDLSFISITNITWHYFESIYPAIDMLVLTDNRSIEYIFIIKEGADPSLIGLKFPESISVEMGKKLKIWLSDIKITVDGLIVAYDNGVKRFYHPQIMIAKDLIKFVIPSDILIPDNLNNTKLNLIPGKLVNNGPEHSLYISKFETTNDQFLKFLNYLEKHQGVKTNVFFDFEGNVYMNKKMLKNRHELFCIKESKLIYNSTKPPGMRYDHIRMSDGTAPFKYCPVEGVTWFGAIKYCNWLTVNSGRGEYSCCYTEGTDPEDWHPVTATNWHNGIFTDTERQMLIKYQGFRLPMINSYPPNMETNRFNELIVTATYNPDRTPSFAFGRETASIHDAFFLFPEYEKEKIEGPFPVGFFNGKNIIADKFQTIDEENFFGVYDLSGNVEEFTTDLATSERTDTITVVGGSYIKRPVPFVKSMESINKWEGKKGVSFRVCTTYMSPQLFTLHIFLKFNKVEPITEELFIPSPTQIIPEVRMERELRTNILFSGELDIKKPDSSFVIPEGLIYEEKPYMPSVVTPSKAKVRIPPKIPVVPKTNSGGP